MFMCAENVSNEFNFLIPLYLGSIAVKDIIVNSHHIPAAASTISSSLMDITQTLDQSAVNQGKLPQQSHTRILSPYKTYS
jgi:hypothetical protein